MDIISTKAVETSIQAVSPLSSLGVGAAAAGVSATTVESEAAGVSVVC